MKAIKYAIAWLLFATVAIGDEGLKPYPVKMKSGVPLRSGLLVELENHQISFHSEGSADDLSAYLYTRDQFARALEIARKAATAKIKTLVDEDGDLLFPLDELDEEEQAEMKNTAAYRTKFHELVDAKVKQIIDSGADGFTPVREISCAQVARKMVILKTAMYALDPRSVGRDAETTTQKRRGDALFELAAAHALKNVTIYHNPKRKASAACANTREDVVRKGVTTKGIVRPCGDLQINVVPVVAGTDPVLNYGFIKGMKASVLDPDRCRNEAYNKLSYAVRSTWNDALKYSSRGAPKTMSDLLESKYRSDDAFRAAVDTCENYTTEIEACGLTDVEYQLQYELGRRAEQLVNELQSGNLDTLDSPRRSNSGTANEAAGADSIDDLVGSSSR